MAQMQYDLPFRWFVGLGIDDPVWVPTVFTALLHKSGDRRTSPCIWTWSRLAY